MKTNRTNNGIARWKTRLDVESLEERSLMSASPLNWTAPTGGTNNIYLGVIGSQVEVFDNGKLVAGQDASATSAINLTTAAKVQNSVTVASTPSGVPTTINLKGVGDSVFLGDTGVTPGGSSLNKIVAVNGGGSTIGVLEATPMVAVKSNLNTATISSIIIGGITTPSVTAATMLNIDGAVTIKGVLAGHDSVTLADAADSDSQHVVISGTGVTGMAPAAINFTGITTLTTDSSTGPSGYAVTGSVPHTNVYLENWFDSASVTSTAGSVYVHGTGFDSAVVKGAATGVNTLTAGPGGATLSGSGYSDQVAGFTRITVNSSSASDVATLTGSTSGGNTLTASPTDAVLTQGSDSVEAVNFPHLIADGSNSGSDNASLTGASTGANKVIAMPDDVIFTGPGYSMSILGFNNTSVTSANSSDTAVLYGSSAGGNTLVGTATEAALGNSVFRNAVNGFASVNVVSGNAGDTAYLLGPTSGNNSLAATPSATTLSGAGFSVTATYFPTVYAYSGSAGDVASFTGAGSFVFATRGTTQMSGTGYFVQAANFPTVVESITATPFEWTSSGSLLEKVNSIQATHGVLGALVAVAPGTLNVSGLHNVFSFWSTVDTAFDNVAIGKLVNSNYVWDCNSTGVHVDGPTPSGAAVGIMLTLNDLTNANIQGVLFRDMVRDGSLTYSGMLDMFDVVEEGNTVSAATLQDLRLIVQCATTLEMPADVADLANSVVNGQEANGSFHSLDAAGNVTSTSMGNLYAGSSTYQLTQLVDTWFLGMDEPDAAKAYSAAQGTLFGSGGPVYTDVQQGDVGDCWLLASAAEVAARDPGYLTSMFTYEGTNAVNGATVSVYSVRMYSREGFGVPHYVTVDTELPASGGLYDHPTNGVLWAALLEKAYAEASGAGWVVTANGNSDSYGVLEGGYPSYAIPALTNLSTSEHNISASAAATAFQAGDLVCLCTSSPSSSEIVPNHCYALVAYTPSSSSPFKVYNPWGAAANGNALGDYDNHSVYGLFNATAAFINSNFNQDSIGAAVPEPDVLDSLASTQAGASAQGPSSDALLLALVEATQASHGHDGCWFSM